MANDDVSYGGKLSSEDLKYLTQRIIKCLCIGIKTDKNKVRCVELDDGNYIEPLYGEEPEFQETEDGYIYVYPGHFVPKEWTRNTAFQCWPTNFKSLSVNKEIWNEILQQWLV